jgi:hypothetical protein
MSFTEFLISWLAKGLNIPADVLTTMKGVNRFHGLSKPTFPKELIPLNTRQLARGILNFAMLQHSLDWVFPFWAERQYDPSDPAFIPRSHLGLSINITHRNWTAVGNPDCPIEPIIDPRGMVTPFPGEWSVEVWMKINNEIFYPSRTSQVQQQLIDNLPIVKTEISAANIKLSITAYTVGSILRHHSEITNLSGQRTSVQIGLAIRPFNPEGVSLIHDLEYWKDRRAFIINNDKQCILSAIPDHVYFSNSDEGDSSTYFGNITYNENRTGINCHKGLANGFAAYDLDLEPGKSCVLECFCPLQNEYPVSTEPHDLGKIKNYWNGLLSEGTTILTPDSRINNLLPASLATLILLTDKTSITPGPATYHQFWFRDAAYMLLALNRFGFHRFSRPIILAMPEYQGRSGYFRSQQGEWDSNGQVLWTIWQYTLLSGDQELVSNVFDSLFKGMRWITKTRRTGRKDRQQQYYGLLPAGLSAEHLGLIDHYFWDNFWSVAGIESFAEICRMLHRPDKMTSALEISTQYRRDIEQAADLFCQKSGSNLIMAAPLRGIDHGMIGSICAWYPLQIIPRHDLRLLEMLRLIQKRFFCQGMFYQQFIHSGLNPYLTLQIAHAWLYAGERKLFWDLFNTVIEYASPTLNFPEAIHTQTKGGCIGDGHHGWAAAEILLAVRDALVYEIWNRSYESYDLLLLSGIPMNWFDEGQMFYINYVPIPGGKINLNVSGRAKSVVLKIYFTSTGSWRAVQWKIKLPFPVSNLMVNGTNLNQSFAGEDEILIPSLIGTENNEIIFFRS